MSDSGDRYLRMELRVVVYLVCMVVTCFYYRLCVAKTEYTPHISDLAIIYIISGVIFLGLLHKNKSLPQQALTGVFILTVLPLPFVLTFRNYYLYEGWKFVTALSIVFLASVNFSPFVKSFRMSVVVICSSLALMKIAIELTLNWLLDQTFYLAWFESAELISISTLITFSVVYALAALICLAYLNYIWHKRKIVKVSRTDLMIVAGCLFYSIVQFFRGYIVFRGYLDSDLYYLIETISIVPGAIWFLAFISRGDSSTQSNRLLFWKIQVVLVGVILLASSQVVPQKSALLHIMFIVSAALVVEALILLAALFYILYRESVDQSRKIIQLSNRMGSIMESAHDAILVVNGDGVIEDVNQEAEKLSRHSRNRLVNSCWSDLVQPLENQLRNGVFDDEPRLYRFKEDDMTIFKLNDVTISMGGRELSVYALQDLTRLRQEMVRNEHLREQVVRGQKMEAAAGMARGIAHDFNNYLTGVRGAAQLLDRVVHPGTREKKYVNMIMDSADEASSLVHQLLDSVRVDRQNARMVSVNAIVSQACKLLVPQLLGVKLIPDMQPKMPSLWIDPAELIRCILNLGRNAIQAMEGKGRLNISVYTKEPDMLPIPDELQTWFDHRQAIIIEIADNGPGIPPLVRDRIFEPYFTTKKSGEGTGLGLGITYGIVKSYHGLMTVDSAVGKGARFMMIFPEYLPAIDQTPDSDR